MIWKLIRWRKAFADDHILPDDILWRQKAAFSDAVGHSMVDDLKDYAESLYSDEAFAEDLREIRICKAVYKRKSPGTAIFLKNTIPVRPKWSRISGCRTKHGRAAM